MHCKANLAVVYYGMFGQETWHKQQLLLQGFEMLRIQFYSSSALLPSNHCQRCQTMCHCWFGVCEFSFQPQTKTN